MHLGVLKTVGPREGSLGFKSRPLRHIYRYLSQEAVMLLWRRKRFL